MTAIIRRLGARECDSKRWYKVSRDGLYIDRTECTEKRRFRVRDRTEIYQSEALLEKL